MHLVKKRYFDNTHNTLIYTTVVPYSEINYYLYGL